MIYRVLIDKWKTIPKEVRLFLRNALLIFTVWQLLYVLLLYPTRLLDDPLTRVTGVLTEKSLQLIYGTKLFHAEYEFKQTLVEGLLVEEGSSMIYLGLQPLISIGDLCNGLNMYALFIGFILAFPSALKLKLGFGFIGLFSLIAVNVARCVGLAALQMHYPHFTLFAHHYVFNVLTYAAVFGLWYLFTKRASK